MNTRFWVSAGLLLALTGCSSGNGLTTGSIFGSETKKTGVSATAAPVVKNDPVTRAFHVGSFSARAVRCGFHFDAVKLKSDYMAYETTAGLPVSEMAKLGNAYSTGFNGVSKGIGNAKQYCSPSKVASIKAALTRYLAGDFTPPVKKVAKVAKNEGFFSGFFDADVVEGSGPGFGSDDWWTKQSEKTGR